MYKAGRGKGAGAHSRDAGLTKRLWTINFSARTIDDMNLRFGGALKGNTLSIATECARSFYHLLANRRRYERMPIAGDVRVTYPIHSVVYSCSCVDISPCGMAIDCPGPMSLGVVITLHVQEQSLSRLARVCYCREHGSAYRIGLEFIAGDGIVTVSEASHS